MYCAGPWPATLLQFFCRHLPTLLAFADEALLSRLNYTAMNTTRRKQKNAALFFAALLPGSTVTAVFYCAVVARSVYTTNDYPATHTSVAYPEKLTLYLKNLENRPICFTMLFVLAGMDSTGLL